MISKWLAHLFISFLLILSVPLISAENELLSIEDIHQVMDNIFEQHVDKKEITVEILKSSFKIYIDHFDPERIYLLASEVDRFLQLSDTEMNRILREYKRKNFSKFEKLNTIIQNAIRRARQYRDEISRRREYLFQSSTSEPASLDLVEDDTKRPFSNDSNELRTRIRDQVVLFISGERKRFGDKSVIENKDKTLQVYEDHVRHRENQYLYEDEDGRLLPRRERENLFVIHVLKALARSLDSHTTFLQPNEAYDMKIRLEKGFHGIGIVLKRKPEGIVISRLIKDGPAERSGLVKAGDRIVKINNENVERDSLEELVEKLRNKSKSTVLLVLKRPVSQRNRAYEKTISVTLTRELIALDEGRVDVKHEPFGNGIIGKLTLHSFYQGRNGITSEKDMRKAIKELQRQGHLRGLILDLRENSGGFLKQAVKVAGLFITNGVVVVSKYSDGEKRYYRDMDGKVSFHGPLIVLTSRATASAAEIVAQALQDYGIAVIVGDEQTYGKGTIQSQTVTDGKTTSHFKVTVGKYYTVSGKTPQVYGVKADIVVPSYYNKELIGEEYLEYSLASDTIKPTYKDHLSDVDPGLKPWYLRYYMPSLQKRETTWKEFLPTLKKNSEERLSRDEDFQKFLSGDYDWNIIFDESEDSFEDKYDLQMKETVNILKEMIELEKKSYNAKLANE